MSLQYSLEQSKKISQGDGFSSPWDMSLASSIASAIDQHCEAIAS